MVCFRFQSFADAPAAQAAFEAAYPRGSPVQPALQALVDMGAHCRTVAPGRFACRFVETERALAGLCWHIGLESDGEAIQRVGISMTILGV
jgi:hypothetical protein